MRTMGSQCPECVQCITHHTSGKSCGPPEVVSRLPLSGDQVAGPSELAFSPNTLGLFMCVCFASQRNNGLVQQLFLF